MTTLHLPIGVISSPKAAAHIKSLLAAWREVAPPPTPVHQLPVISGLWLVAPIWHSAPISLTLSYCSCWRSFPEAAFLDEIQTKVFRAFLIDIHSHLYSFAFEISISSNSCNLTQFLQFSYSTLSRRKEENLKTIVPSIWSKKFIQKSQVWKHSRLCPETSKELNVHEFSFNILQAYVCYCFSGIFWTFVCRCCWYSLFYIIGRYESILRCVNQRDGMDSAVRCWPGSPCLNSVITCWVQILLYMYQLLKLAGAGNWAVPARAASMAWPLQLPERWFYLLNGRKSSQILMMTVIVLLSF